ncbi:MAG: hypothetical protein GY874_00180 [Desulfobacteraceae bacterium]|nr:hypothetical protein [Desulfobacteraceae bacterium]
MNNYRSDAILRMDCKRICSMASIAILFFFIIFCQCPLYAQDFIDEPLFKVQIATSDPQSVHDELVSAGYDVLGIQWDLPAVEVAGPKQILKELEIRGYTIAAVERGRPLNEMLPKTKARDVPSNYSDLQNVYDKMIFAADQHPDITKFVDLTETYNTPETHGGRHLFALKISDHVNLDEDEPAMLVVGNHHAREIVTPVICLYAIDELTFQYGHDEEITQFVNEHEIWIAPVWNPDGYNHVFTVDNLWRKNRRIFTEGVGVDLNRNYPQGWSASCGGSTNVSSNTYKGPSPGSEAETETMMVWSQKERFVKIVDLHSSGQEVLYGYKCSFHPFTDWMKSRAEKFSMMCGYDGDHRQPSAEGEHVQWQFAQMGADAHLVETATSFQPPYSFALKEAEKVWPGIIWLAQSPVPLTGHVTDAANGNPVTAEIQILNVNFENGESNYSSAEFGRYHVFFPPGGYELRFSANGYLPSTHGVTIQHANAQVLDIELISHAIADNL